MYNYKQILDWKFASNDYTITDAYDYDTLVWNDSAEKPSKEFLENKLDLIKGSQLTSIQQLRAKEYPSFADQFDLLYHGGYDAWKAAIDEVKTTYPKPE